MHAKKRSASAKTSQVLGLVFLMAASAGAIRATADDANVDGLTAISPIFGQLVSFTQPAKFVAVFEQPTPGRYIREAVLKGETVESWTEMITVTGVEGATSNQDATPERFATAIVDGFERACPQSFATAILSKDQIDDHDAYAVVASCGEVGPEGSAHSETALIIAIEGEDDYYTVQWAERTEASSEALDIDDRTWRDRMEQLSPIRLCPIVPGEKAPYPSCVSAD